MTRVSISASLEDILQREGVDNGTQHAHVVRGDAVHALLPELRPTHDVAAADDEPDLGPHVDGVLDLVGKALNDLEVEPEAAIAGECLAGELHEHALIRERRHSGSRGGSIPHVPST